MPFSQLKSFFTYTIINYSVIMHEQVGLLFIHFCYQKLQMFQLNAGLYNSWKDLKRMENAIYSHNSTFIKLFILYCRSINHSIFQTVNQSINQSIKQSINQQINQSINQSPHHPLPSLISLSRLSPFHLPPPPLPLHISSFHNLVFN